VLPSYTVATVSQQSCHQHLTNKNEVTTKLLNLLKETFRNVNDSASIDSSLVVQNKRDILMFDKLEGLLHLGYIQASIFATDCRFVNINRCHIRISRHPLTLFDISWVLA